MTLKERIIRNLLCCGLSKEDYSQIRETVLEHNRHTLVSWSAVACCFWVYCLFMSLRSDAYAMCRLVYAGALIGCFVTLFCAAFPAVRFRRMRFPLLVFFDMTLLLASVGIAVCQPDVRSITMFSMVILVPICFVERTILSLVLLVLNLIVYIILGAGVIESEIFYWGLWNLVIFSIMGFLVGHIINKSRFERYIYAESVKKLADMKIAKESADRASAAKSEFLANMSHEIRTPINAMLGMNEIIMRETLRADDPRSASSEACRNAFSRIRNYSVNIDTAGKSLLSIVNDILDFSRIESGKMHIVEGNYRLSSVLAETCAMFSLWAADKSMDFHVQVDENLPDCLFGDEVRVRQILNNLLSNAFKYTEKGSVSLSVRRAEEDGATDAGTVRIEISVQDTGTGIRKEDLGRLFAKFERVNLEQNSTVEGTGLGLAITRTLVEMMGGGIQVESVFGKGSVFRATLLQKKTSDEPVGRFSEIIRAEQKPAEACVVHFRAPDARILIVDDTRLNLLVTSGLLSGTDIRIDTAGSGAEAITLCETISYDLILMDQRMPVMDGVETMHRIRQADNPNSRTPFICLTADAVSGAREHYLSEGFTDYLSKPISGAVLAETVMKYLPQEKVFTVQAPEKALPDDSPPAGDEFRDPAFSSLTQAGIDPASGLDYCRNSPELYRTLLSEYARDAGEKADSLRRCFETRDWQNYTVYVHALKSSSRLIGAEGLSGKAAALEKAARAEDAAVIEAGHLPLLQEYQRVVDVIRESGFCPPAPEDAGEPEILDFPPV